MTLSGPAYLLAFGPVSGEVPAGREWSYRVLITPDAD